MTSTKWLTISGIFIWAAVALTAVTRCRPAHAHSLVVRAAHEELAESCSDLHTSFDGRGAILASEERTLSKADAPLLRVDAETNGGIQVQGWDKDTYSVTLCKAAADDGDAQSTLAQIHISFHGGQLGVSGPSSHRQWSAHLLIRSPKASALELTAINGPVTLRDVDGSLKVRAENGPVTVTGCSGELDLKAQNGPLTLEHNRGKQTVNVQNGPITLALAGESWDGAGLQARATNGPVTLQIPSGYRSGVVLESEGNGPFQCHAVCSEGQRTWDDEHKRIEFGSGPALVRVSTVNGPVIVN